MFALLATYSAFETPALWSAFFVCRESLIPFYASTV